jgi:hypothetical protein
MSLVASIHRCVKGLVFLDNLEPRVSVCARACIQVELSNWGKNGKLVLCGTAQNPLGEKIKPMIDICQAA